MRFFAKLKAFTQMIFSNANPWDFILPRTIFNYAREVGDCQGSSTVMAPVLWIARTYPEAPIAVEIVGEIEHDHDMLKVINKPNAYYSGLTLSMATIISFTTAGNAYWIKIRNNQLAVKELWYAPHWLIQPKAPKDGSQYISHYEYRPNGLPIRLNVEDVVHFRFGLDPRNMRLGLSPLASVLREIFTDDEAANFTAALLKNSGVPGLIISPAKDMALPGDAEAVKEAYKDKFGGDKRGEPLVLTGPTEIKKIAFSPQDLDLGKLRNIPEERVTAVLGIPAAVVGFGTGLQQTKVGAPQPLSARLWTVKGPTTMGAIVPGDKIAIPGGWSQIRHVYPQGEQDIYCVTFQDGSTAESTIDHLWDVHTPNQGRRVVPLSEIASWPAWKLKRAALPLQGVTEFNEQPILIPPYVLGFLLADGSFRGNLFFSNINLEIVEMIREQVGMSYALNQTQSGKYDYRIAYRESHRGRGIGGGSGSLNPFVQELRRLSLWMLRSSEKFIPDLYKYNTARVRLQLLQGILDGGGYVNLHRQPAIEQTSTRLAEDITEIVQSLGGYTLRTLKRADRSIRFIKGHPMASCHDRIHLTIVIDDATTLFCCIEKRDRCRPRTKTASRKIRHIEFVRREQAQCIQVDGSLYLTDNFIVTHNTMSELREMAYESCIIPTQRLIASEIQNQLLPDFEANLNKVRVVYDLSGVRVLQEDQNKLAKRLDTMVKGGWLLVSTAQRLMGMEVDKTQNIYLRSFSMIEVPAGTSAPKIADNGHDKKAKLFLSTKHKATEQQQRLVNRFNQDTIALTKIFAGELKKAFEKLAKDVVEAWQQIAEQYVVDYSKSDKPDLKVTQEDIYADLVGTLVNPENYIDYRTHYLRVANQTVGTINSVIGLGVNLSDLAEIRIISEAGTRKGLLEITNQVKDSLFQAITEAREEGLGPPATARRIRDLIEKGPWSSADVRSKIIARTETKYAQNVSSIEAYKESDTVNAILVFDGQLETSCQICIDRHGSIVTFDESEIMIDTEHPMGTLSLAPVVGGIS